MVEEDEDAGGLVGRAMVVYVKVSAALTEPFSDKWRRMCRQCSFHFVNWFLSLFIY